MLHCKGLHICWYFTHTQIYLKYTQKLNSEAWCYMYFNFSNIAKLSLIKTLLIGVVHFSQHPHSGVECLFNSWLLCFLLMCLKSSRWWIQYVGLCHPHGRATWETQMEFLVPGFGLAQPPLSQPSTEWASREKIDLSPPRSPLCVTLAFKQICKCIFFLKKILLGPTPWCSR